MWVAQFTQRALHFKCMIPADHSIDKNQAEIKRYNLPLGKFILLIRRLQKNIPNLGATKDGENPSDQNPHQKVCMTCNSHPEVVTMQQGLVYSHKLHAIKRRE